MKSKKLKCLEVILRLMAIAIIKRHQPTIIGITGSVGKTSTKEAVFLVLSSRFRTRKNEKNYNNEIGIPLTIIGAETGGKSILKWLEVFLKWLSALIWTRYPEFLVLEMGADRIGDIGYLTSFVPLRVGIVTNVSESHLEFFKNLSQIAGEKRKIIKNLPPDGLAILNSDNERVRAMREKTKARVITYGFAEDADFRAENISFGENSPELKGINFKLNSGGKIIPFRLPHILARHLVYSVLAAAAVGEYFKINLVDTALVLEKFVAHFGRMNLIAGIKNSFIIDDTYNSSPVSAVAALETLAEAGNFGRKIAVLGDMLELGEETENKHRLIGKKVFETKVDLFVAVGDRMKFSAEELRSSGYSAEKIFHFDDPESAGEKIRAEIKSDDFVLVKGSQGMRMEKVVEKIMAEPDDKEKILCRQTADWQKKPFLKP